MNTSIDALHQKGWNFIPLEKRGKAPINKWKDFIQKPADILTINEWIATGNNIGVICGSASGFFVLDFDHCESLQEIKDYDLPETLISKTGKGYHYFFNLPDFEIKNHIRIFENADIKGENGYIVCAPSIHKNGSQYNFINNNDIADAPECLLNKIRKKQNKKRPEQPIADNQKTFQHSTINKGKYAQAALAGEIQKILSAGIGSRNSTLNTAAFCLGGLVGNGTLSEAEVCQGLTAAALQIGLTEHEVNQTIISGLKAGKLNPREIPATTNVDSKQPEKILDVFARDLPITLLPGENVLQSDFADTSGKIAAKNGLYNFNDLPIEIENGKTKIMEAYRFRTWFEKYSVCIKEKNLRDHSFQIKNSCSVDTAKTTLQSPFFIEQLPRLEKIFEVQLPVYRAGKLGSLQPGYNSKENVFVKDDCIIYDKNWSFERGKNYIINLLSEFPFADDTRSRAIVIAGMLTEFCKLLFPKNTQKPVFIFVANSEGSGKTLLSKIINFPVHGNIDIKSLPNNDEAIRDELNTAVLHAKNVIIFDNVRGNLTSQSMEAFCTAATWSFRIKGFNKEFCGSADINLYITGNDLSYTPDLRRRSLRVDLFSKCERNEDRQISHWIDDLVLMEKRKDILAALWSLVKNWYDNGKPPCNFNNSTFRRWSDTVSAIVSFSGLGNPLEQSKAKNGGDKTGDDMNSLIKSIVGGLYRNEMAFSEITEKAFENNLFDWIILEPVLDRKERAIFSKILKKYDGRIFNIDGEMVEFSITGNARHKKFCVEKQEKGNGGNGGNAV